MTINERYQYLRRMQKRYRQANHEMKKQLLDEMITHTKLHRKSLIRLMKGKIEQKPRKRERENEYDTEVDATLKLIWESLDCICPERITPNLISTAELLDKHQELRLTPKLRRELERISVSTVRRHLPPHPYPHRRRRPPATLNRHQKQIPAYRISRNIGEPGHFELDLVHHCGDSTSGEYIYTLQIIDVATGWSGRRAILGRSYLVVADALLYLFQRLPFSLLELHPDNGGEFLNDHLLAFMHNKYPSVILSRSRPARPNDNRLVEQKNSTLVRNYLGDRRFDTVTQTRFLNSIYAKMNTYYNYIQPVMKQISKVWIPATSERPSRIQRSHDQALPPVFRLCSYLPHDQQLPLLQFRDSINPRALRDQIYQDLDHLFSYPCATPHETQSVFQTLADPDAFPEACAALEGVDTVDKPKNGLPTVPTAPATTTSFSLFDKEEAASSVT